LLPQPANNINPQAATAMAARISLSTSALKVFHTGNVGEENS
jgi:hypothetical protein